MCALKVIGTAYAPTVKPIYRFLKKSEHLIIHLRLLIKLGETLHNPFAQCEKWKNPLFLCLVTFLHVCIHRID